MQRAGLRQLTLRCLPRRLDGVRPFSSGPSKGSCPENLGTMYIEPERPSLSFKNNREAVPYARFTDFAVQLGKKAYERLLDSEPPVDRRRIPDEPLVC